jgi:hypothetical protein
MTDHGLTISFDGEAWETGAGVLASLKGYTVDIPREPHGIIHTYVIVGADQRQDENEVKLIVRPFDHESGKAYGPELRLPWDSHLIVN